MTNGNRLMSRLFLLPFCLFLGYYNTAVTES